MFESLVKWYNTNKVSKNLPRDGYATQYVDICLVIDQQCELLHVTPMQEKKGRSQLELPVVIRSSGIKPNIGWDNAGYSIGYSFDAKKGGFTEKKLDSFIDKLAEVEKYYSDDEDSEEYITAMILKSFCERIREEPEFQDFVIDEIRQVIKNPKQDINVVFEIREDESVQNRYVHDIIDAFVSSSGDTVSSVCSVTGHETACVKNHTKLKRIGQSSGSSLISFNFDSVNTPVTGVSAAVSHATHTTLNYMLDPANGHRVSITDNDTLLIWTESTEIMDDFLGAVVVDNMESVSAYLISVT